VISPATERLPATATFDKKLAAPDTVSGPDTLRASRNVAAPDTDSRWFIATAPSSSVLPFSAATRRPPWFIVRRLPNVAVPVMTVAPVTMNPFPRTHGPATCSA